MERVFKKNPVSLSLQLILPLSLATVVLSASLACQAGVVLLPPEKEPPPTKPTEIYQDSRFGRPPAPMRTGIDASYASRAVTEMEEEEDPGRPRNSRNPASLVFSNQAPQPHRPMVVEAASVPAHPANRNARASSRAVADEAPRNAAPAVGAASAGRFNERSPVLPGSEPDPRLELPERTSVFRKGVQEVAIIAHDLGYFPKAIFVTRDVPVRLFVTGASKSTLCIMMDSFGVRKQVRSQKIEEITFTPSTPGKYRFYCPVNGMEGTMIVRELVDNAPPAIPDTASVSEPAPAPAAIPATASLVDPAK